MEEARLIHLLRGLPREMAPGGFTAHVLKRLDEPARTAGAARGRHVPRSVSWNRMMVATATVGALGVSVGLAIGLLHGEHVPPGSTAGLAASLGPLTAPAAARTGTPVSEAAFAAAAAAGRAALTATSMDRTFRHEGAAAEQLALALGPRRAANRTDPGNQVLDAARARQMWRELRVESGRLERELGSLRQPARGKSPTVLYLGGDDNVDLVLSTGRTRPAGPPAGDRDDGENLEYL